MFSNTCTMTLAQKSDRILAQTRGLSGATPNATQLIEELRWALEENRREVDRITAERDEARRMYCEEAFCHRFNESRFNERCVPSPISNPRQIAHNMKWDCFKEPTDGK